MTTGSMVAEMSTAWAQFIAQAVYYYARSLITRQWIFDSLKRTKVIKIFYSREILSEPMRY